MCFSGHFPDALAVEELPESLYGLHRCKYSLSGAAQELFAGAASEPSLCRLGGLRLEGGRLWCGGVGFPLALAQCFSTRGYLVKSADILSQSELWGRVWNVYQASRG